MLLLARVTRQLMHLRVGGTTSTSPMWTMATATKALSWTEDVSSTFTNRHFASKPSKKKKSEPKAHVPSENNPSQPFLQNQEWVKFQQSISVDGFQTGQTLQATVLKKSKGGKQARNRKAREVKMLQQQQEKGSENRFPAIRYTPEETQDLLKLAYETLPKRDGKRGTRNQKRQDRRWKLVRNIRSKYKAQIKAAHERRMVHRQWTRAQTKAVKEAAPSIVAEQQNYQAELLKRWANSMYSNATTTEDVDPSALKQQVTAE